MIRTHWDYLFFRFHVDDKDIKTHGVRSCAIKVCQKHAGMVQRVITAAVTTKHLCAVLTSHDEIQHNKDAHFNSHHISIRPATCAAMNSAQPAVKLFAASPPPVINNHMGSNQTSPGSCCIRQGLNMRQQVLFHGSTFCLDHLQHIWYVVMLFSFFFFFFFCLIITVVLWWAGFMWT